jgi:ribonuclease BN (tRNA processing enzyme)
VAQPTRRSSPPAKGAGTLIIDSMFTPDQYTTHQGWGHGTWRNAVAIAEACDVGRLVLYHHNPHHSDDELDRILAEARALFPRTDAAFEGMELDF